MTTSVSSARRRSTKKEAPIRIRCPVLVGGYAQEGFVGGGVVEDDGLGVFEGLYLGVLVVVVLVLGGGVIVIR